MEDAICVMPAHVCHFCDKDFFAEDELDIHMFLHMSENQECKECLLIKLHRNKLILKLLIHIRERKHECGECDALSLEDGRISQHIIMHMNDGTHKQDHTDTVVSEADLPPSDGPYECNILTAEGPNYRDLSFIGGPSESDICINEESCEVPHLSQSRESDINIESSTDIKKTYSCTDCKEIFADEEELHVRKNTHGKQNEFEIMPFKEKSQNLLEIQEPDINKEIDRMLVNRSTSKQSNVVTNENKNEALGLPKEDLIFDNTIIKQEAIYECHQCHQSFSDGEELGHHKLSHTKQSNTKLEKGNRHGRRTNKKSTVSTRKLPNLPVVKDEQNTRSNVIEKAKNPRLSRKNHECQECGKKFLSLDKLKSHMISEDNELLLKCPNGADGKYKCQECGQIFFDSGELQTHMNKHNKKKETRKCMVCLEVFNEYEEYRKHIHEHKERKEHKQFPCEVCGKVFLYKSTYLNHMSHHTGVKDFKCTPCNKSFATSELLKKHSKIHTDSNYKNYECKECGKMLSLKSSLRRHLTTHFGKKKFKCTDCGKCFLTNHNLKAHLLVHSGEKRHQCSECGKCFSQLGHLSTHMVVHSDKRNYKCHICGKLFSRKIDIERHLICHTGEKNYQCHVCGKCFARDDHLRDHLHVHSDVKSFTCNECGKSFARSVSLKRHMIVHFGLKNFKCNQCEKRFLRRSELIVHFRVHTKEKNYKCDVCGRCFSHVNTFKNHMKRLHK